MPDSGKSGQCWDSDPQKCATIAGQIGFPRRLQAGLMEVEGVALAFGFRPRSGR